ncbi:MAG TPA: DNA-3-methyladenine glycosylase [Alphaproteobacteria bacterium]|jgi:DNA-3-methyladenine glycosylase|nr:DNA-3-methyladenine glycosylase [Alphaproteobacteria bacterium]
MGAPVGGLSAAAAAPRRLRRRELPRDTEALARWLIGKTLVHDVRGGRMSGRIVEAEAYVVGDAAGHAFGGRTRRNASLFLERGHAYVYFGYGMWFLLNVSSEPAGVGAGVLLRALEPVEGLALMRRRRGRVADRDLARGPGRLARALGVDLRLDGLDLCGAESPLWLGAALRPVGEIGVSVRIGITREAHRPLRFFERGNPCVSGPRKLSA